MNNTVIIGFIGDGQLARMSAMEAIKLGFRCHFFGNDETGPCAGLGQFFNGLISEEKKIVEFAKTCNIVTLENEFIDSAILEQIDKLPYIEVYPSSNSYKLIENKLIEKLTYQKASIPICHYSIIENEDDLFEFALKYKYPFILKSSKGGYDGYGNFFVQDKESAKEGLQALKKNPTDMILAEELVSFEKEVAITVARSKTGEMKIYPVVDTIQKNHICHYVCAPAQLDQSICEEIQLTAKKAMLALDAVGVFSFEFFILKDGSVLLNECAPRPHNSAHYSMDACETSQFENHIRAISGLPLGEPVLKFSQALMINLLGTQNGLAKLENADSFFHDKNLKVHLYDKKESRIGRKMGHVNLWGQDRDELFQKADLITNTLRI